MARHAAIPNPDQQDRSGATFRRRPRGPDLSGPIPQPVEGQRSVTVEAIRQAVKALIRDRAAHTEA